MKTNIMKIVTAASVIVGYAGINVHHAEAFEITAHQNKKVLQQETEQEATAFLSNDLPIKEMKINKKDAQLARAEEKEQEATQDKPSEQKQTKQDNSSEAIRTIQVEATAYTAFCDGCSGITKTGQNLRKNPNQKIIAVDPDVIPLGSKVYVEGYGTAIAGDIGSAIQGNRIDVFIPSQSDAMDFGRRHNVTVKILERA